MVRSHSSNATATNFIELLAGMQEAHHALRVCMEEMEELTQRPNCSDIHYTSARLRISQASFRRRSQFQLVCQALRKLVDEREAHALKKLNASDAELLAHSSDHVSRWTTAEIERDWEGYCAASREIRDHMMRNLQTERAELSRILLKMAPQALPTRA